MFVDSDDWICEDAIEKLMNKSIEWDADIVEGSVLFVDDNGRTLSRKGFLCEQAGILCYQRELPSRA